MTNTLKINARDSEAIDSRMGIAIELYAEYKGETYNFVRLTGGVAGDITALIFHFDRQNSRIPHGLNTILFMTDCQGHYKATGLSRLNRGDGKPEFYKMGDDLEIVVDAIAEFTFKSIGDSCRKPVAGIN